LEALVRGLSDDEWEEEDYVDLCEVLERIEMREALDDDFYNNEDDNETN